MKRAKLFAITLQSKSGLVFFAVLSAYNLLLGVYLKDFLVLLPVLLTFYLLSVLPTLFFVLKIRSTSMRAVVLIVLFFVMLMSIVSALSCRSQNIHCYAVDGVSYKDSAARHTWNRVYYDGAWWNVDITTDNSRTANGKELYGFHKLEGAFVPDEDFFITKIY